MANQKLKIITVLIIGFILFPVATLAAVLYLDPSEGEYQLGDTFIVGIKIDTEDECINTVKADLEFSQALLKAVDFSQGQSIITLWLKSPEINQESGLISFIGGIPGGYCGEIPGDPGPGHLLGKMIFRVISPDIPSGLAQVIFQEGSQVLLNDGLATPAKLTTKGSVFTILPEKIQLPKDEWQEEIEKDTIPPEPFEIEIHQEPSIFEGRYFITFSTTDKQTGFDRFEVKESERDWKRTESPYLLEDQTLQSIIKVKAVDKAGNERTAEHIPEIPKKPLPYWIIILILIGAGIIWWIIKKNTSQKR